MISYIEMCAGLGGLKLGLDLASWKCNLAADIDPFAVKAHSIVAGPCEIMDVTSIDPKDLPEFDVLIAGFPCQPFSTSGPRRGFGHRSGNVFSALCEIIKTRQPKAVLFENVPGLLTHDKGATFREILREFHTLKYSVEWATINLSWFGVPQTRSRVFILGIPSSVMENRIEGLQDRRSLFRELEWGIAFRNLIEQLGQPIELERFSVSTAIASITDPSNISNKWSAFGLLHDDSLLQGSISQKEKNHSSSVLGAAIAPALVNHQAIRPVRFYARGKPTFMHLRPEFIGYCLGNIPGGAPLFAISLDALKNRREKDAFLEYSNWSREQEGHVVMRLSPERALYLFGEEAVALSMGLTEPTLTLTKKYQLVGNMVSPKVSFALASVVEGVIRSEGNQ